MEAIDRFFPGSSLTRSSVLYCYSGYRALPSAKANGSAPWSVGREDMVEVAQSGLATVVSGKLTTSRSLAKRVLDRLTGGSDGVNGWSACRTDQVPIGGGDGADAAGPDGRTASSPALAGYLESLYAKYGSDAHGIIAGTPADESSPPFRGEVRYVCRSEMACTLEDIVERRVAPLSWSSRQRLEYLRRAAPVIRRELEMGRGGVREPSTTTIGATCVDTTPYPTDPPPAPGGSFPGPSAGRPSVPLPRRCSIVVAPRGKGSTCNCSDLRGTSSPRKASVPSHKPG